MESDQFERRLAVLNKAPSTPVSEIDAAVTTRARLETAKAICESVFRTSAPPLTLVVPVFEALCSEAQSGQASRKRE